MTARILVAADRRATVKPIEMRLSAAYFDVLTASSGTEALAICEQGRCDVILIETMMPDMDGFEVCRWLKSVPATDHIPVGLVTERENESDLVRGLEAGADDFLVKPLLDAALIARVRSLVRLRLMSDELRMRALTSREIGIESNVAAATADDGHNGRILLVDDCAASRERCAGTLVGEHTVEIEAASEAALARAAEGHYDLVVASLGLEAQDALRFCSELRSVDHTRNLPILALAHTEEDQARLARSLEIGVNDFVFQPLDHAELTARVRIQVRKKRYAERLREPVQNPVEGTIADPLTALHNRRYMEQHLATLVDQAVTRSKPVAVLALDIDFFNAINDNYGRGAGDEVLRQLAERLRKSVRGIDLPCRSGGEEFVVVMPDANRAVAARMAERLRQRIASEAFPIHDGGRSVGVTISVGVSGLAAPDDTPSQVLKRADEALQRAQRDGRNRVVADAA